MRTKITTTTALLSVALLIGCGSDSKRRYSNSTAAPATSTTTGSTTSGSTTPTTSGTTTNPPPVQTLLTEATIASWQLKEVLHVDAKTGQVNNRWATGDGPVDVVNTNTETFVANAISQDITTIDRLAGVAGPTIDVTSVPLTGTSLLGFLDQFLKPLVRPTGLAITPNGRKIYSANLLNVTAIDGTTRQATKSILGFNNNLSLQSLISNPGQAINNFLAAPVRGLGMAKVAATNDYAVVTCMITGTVMRIDARTDTIAGYTDVGRAPIGVAIARNKAYVACALSQEVWIVDVVTGAVLGQLQAGMVPVDVAVSPSEDRIYVANAISGDISVIDTATDQVVDTLPAGMSVASIFNQLGVTLPTGGSGSGVGNLLNGFLQGFVSGMSNPSSFGSLISGGGSGSILSPGNLINGLLTGFLAYAGVTQQQLAGLNFPALGIMSVGVAHDPDLVLSGNALMGEMGVTDIPTRTVSPVSGLTGLGPVDLAPVWRR